MASLKKIAIKNISKRSKYPPSIPIPIKTRTNQLNPQAI